VRNPHGDGRIPPRARLVSYPIVEKNSALWVWMGDVERADESLLPVENFLVNPAYSAKTCYLKIHTNYQLVIDNLLDLTHGPFLHPTTLSASRKDSAGRRLEHSFWTEGRVIHSDYHYAAILPAPLMRSLFTEATGELWAKMAWAPASILNFDLSLHPIGGGKGGVHMPSFHYLVPETEFTTHYFAAIARDVKINDAAEDEQMID
jgi:phenylpropionate dioxygenase-like ring-hydroxylating dioxygenase large terminal subunit